jgi:heat shock protein HtpX
MKIAKRVFLFMAVNLLVMATISILVSVLGLNQFLSSKGIDYGTLALFCLVWGMGASFISLMFSKTFAKMGMGVQIIPPDTQDPELRSLVETVHQLSDRAGLTKMPEVGIYDSPEVNAFATGPSSSNSLVAVSTGLLRSMNRQQAHAVLAHEVSHVANGDMVTLALIQGVVNAFVMFLSRIIAWAVAQNVREDARNAVYFIVTIVLDIALTLLGSMVVAYFSRAREYRADAGAAEINGKEGMISALQALQRIHQPVTHDRYEMMKISGGSGGLMALLASHPPLEKRIQALQERA